MTTPVDIVRRFYDALGRGDVPVILSLLDAQVEWTEAERFPYYGGTWHGPQAVVDNLLVPLSLEWDAFSAKPHEFIAEGNRVVALGTYSGTFKNTGRSFSAAFAHVWTVRGNKLARFEMHTDTAKVREALGSYDVTAPCSQRPKRVVGGVKKGKLPPGSGAPQGQ